MGGRKKGSKNATSDEIRKFRNFVDKQGLGIKEAARRVNKSESWGRKVNAASKQAPKAESGLPEPKTFAELDGGVKDTLKDFNLFREVFLCRRPVPWGKDAANRTVEMLLEKSETTYAVINVAPGSGKTTLFTHDIPAWLICGGGSEDPEVGRSLRLLLGHRQEEKAKEYVTALRRFFELRNPYWDRFQKRQAELVPALAFGRFKPLPVMGEDYPWRGSAITVAQIGQRELHAKEPTVQAAGAGTQYLGSRIDYYVWDDLVTKDNSSSVEVSETLATKFEDEAETRLEPGGVGLLVGQRFSNLDLFRNRLDRTYVDEEGVEHRIYEHIVYPAHFDDLCDGNHRQWDGAEDGCLLDEERLSWRKLERAQSNPGYNTVFQQRDADVEAILVQPQWIEGERDHTGYLAPGCYDEDRGFNEWPTDGDDLFDYVTVDPSTSNFWAVEWWAIDPSSGRRYLIYGTRRKMQAGEWLQWDAEERRHVGLMEELQQRSIALKHPIGLWIVEQVSAYKYLFQFQHFDSWRQKYPDVDVMAHETQRNKRDPQFGVEALLPMLYKTGRKRLPRKPGDFEARAYVQHKVRELTTYPFARTDDTVLCDWFGENNMPRILDLARRRRRPGKVAEGLKLPPYLEKQRNNERSLYDDEGDEESAWMRKVFGFST